MKHAIISTTSFFCKMSVWTFPYSDVSWHRFLISFCSHFSPRELVCTALFMRNWDNRGQPNKLTYQNKLELRSVLFSCVCVETLDVGVSWLSVLATHERLARSELSFMPAKLSRVVTFSAAWPNPLFFAMNVQQLQSMFRKNLWASGLAHDLSAVQSRKSVKELLMDICPSGAQFMLER